MRPERILIAWLGPCGLDGGCEESPIRGALGFGPNVVAVGENSGDRRAAAIHGRNLDWPDPGKLLRDSTTVRIDGGPTTYYTVGFPGQAGVLTGSADHRFSISLNAVYTDKVAWGAAPVYLIRKALDESKSFDEALRLICKTKLMVGALFLLMDGAKDLRKARMVVIERTPDKYFIRRQKEYGAVSAVICTNDYVVIKPQDAGVRKNGEELQETSCCRYCALENNLNENPEIFRRDQLLKTMINKDVQLPCTIHTVTMCTTFAEEPRVFYPK